MPDARANALQLLQEAREGRRTLIMGIVNVTPDSFSDGGALLSPADAIDSAVQMAADGAHLIDVGGESTRPATFSSHAPLDASEELRRILPVIEGIAARLPHVPISVDTYKAGVARRALDAGAAMINDISALRADPEMARLAADRQAPVCLMHTPGLPTEIPAAHIYENVVAEVAAHLRERAEAAEAAGISRDAIVLDPGFGFGKSAAENLLLLRNLGEICRPGYPVLAGMSRKSTIGKVLGGLSPSDRLEGTAATVALAVAYGAAIVRVHDVKFMARVARMSDAVVRGWP